MKNERGVKVAQDVINRIKNIRFSRSVYVSGDITDLGDLSGDLQPIVDKVEKHCDVCLLGACVLSKARIMDEVPLDKFGITPLPEGMAKLQLSPGVAQELLEDVFSSRTIQMTECAFEHCTRFADVNVVDEGGDEMEYMYAAAAFGYNHPDREGCALAVMNNIVVNEGEFVLTPMSQDVYDAAYADEEGYEDDEDDDDFDDDEDDDDDDFDEDEDDFDEDEDDNRDDPPDDDEEEGAPA